MRKQIELWQYITKNFPYANHVNGNCEYSEEEYNMAKKLLDQVSGKLKKEDNHFIIQSFACLIRSINTNISGFNETDSKYFKEKGEMFKQYHKMIHDFEQVIFNSSLVDNYKSDKNDSFFPIKEVVFKGPKTKDKIILKGPILDIIKKMLIAISDTISEEDKKRMKDFSSSLYNAYENYWFNYKLLNTDESNLAKKVVRSREETKLEIALNQYKYQTAFNIHCFLKNNSARTSTKVPAWHCNFIGLLFSDLGLSDYVDYTDNKTIRNWIEWGNP